MGEEKKVSRRDYLKYTGAAIGGLVVGGALGYLLKPAEVVEKTATVTIPGVEKTVTVTAPGVEKTVTKTISFTEITTTPIIKPGKISFMNMGGIATDILNEIVADFKKKFPGSDVLLDNVPHAQGHEKYLTLFKGGTPPDVGYFLDIWVPEFAEMDALVALDEFLGPTEWKKVADEFIGNSEDVCLWKGKHYAIPMYYSTRAMLYRKDKLEEVGFKIPNKDEWSYEMLYEAVKAIHKPEVGFYGFGMPLKDPKHTLRVFCQLGWPKGVELLDEKGKPVFNTQEAIDTLEYLVSLKPYSQPGAETYNEGDVYTLLYGGKLGFFVAGGAYTVLYIEKNYPELRPKIDYALPPKGKAGHKILQIADVLVMFNACKNKELAWEFMKYWIDPDWRLKLDQFIGFMPLTYGEASKPFFQTDFWKFWVEIGDKYGKFFPIWPWWPEIQSIIASGIASAWMGEKKPEDAIKYAYDESIKVYEKWIK